MANLKLGQSMAYPTKSLPAPLTSFLTFRKLLAGSSPFRGHSESLRFILRIWRL
jgi:hypothetical protein